MVAMLLYVQFGKELSNDEYTVKTRIHIISSSSLRSSTISKSRFAQLWHKDKHLVHTLALH